MAATPDQLHTYALNAERNLEQLATGLASVGAQDTAVKAISTMAHSCRQIAAQLAKGGTQDQNAQQPAQPAPDQQGPPRTMDEAAQRMQSRMQQPPQ